MSFAFAVLNLLTCSTKSHFHLGFQTCSDELTEWSLSTLGRCDHEHEWKPRQDAVLTWHDVQQGDEEEEGDDDGVAVEIHFHLLLLFSSKCSKHETIGCTVYSMHNGFKHNNVRSKWS